MPNSNPETTADEARYYRRQHGLGAFMPPPPPVNPADQRASARHSSPAFAGPTWPRLEGGEYLIVPPYGWTCFHCGMTFTDFWAARGHFGPGHLKVKPACIRHAEREDVQNV